MGGIPELVWEVYSYGSIILCLRMRTRVRVGDTGPCCGHVPCPRVCHGTVLLDADLGRKAGLGSLQLFASALPSF